MSSKRRLNVQIDRKVMDTQQSALQQIHDSVQRIRVVDFFASVDRCLGRKHIFAGRAKNKDGREEHFFQAVDIQAVHIGSLITVALKALIELPENSADKTGKTRFYFRSMKKQQTELLIRIGDEIEIVRAVVRQSLQMQTLMQAHARHIHEAETLLAVIRERFHKRPSFVMYSASDDDKIQTLNKIFSDMRKYETNLESGFSVESGCCLSDNITTIFSEPLHEVRNDIAVRKKRLAAFISELREGFKILQRLAIGGYAWRNKKQLNKMVERHNQRIGEFHEYIIMLRQCMLQPSTPVQPSAVPHPIFTQSP